MCYRICRAALTQKGSYEQGHEHSGEGKRTHMEHTHWRLYFLRIL